MVAAKGGYTRVSPGVYRSSTGALVGSTDGGKTFKPMNGITSNPPSSGGKYRGQKLPDLTDNQNASINQRQKGDLGLGAIADSKLSAIKQAEATPIDYSQYKGPTQGDFQGWYNNQVQGYDQAFDTRNQPLFQHQSDQFEQDMQNRGIPVGSDLYNRQKLALQNQQSDATQQAHIAATSQAAQNAQAQFGVGTQDAQNQLTLAIGQRNQPLQDYNALYGATSGMDMQNLGYSQTGTLQGRNNATQLQISQNELKGKIKAAGMNNPLGGYNGTGLTYEQALAAQNKAQQDNLNFQYNLGPSSGSQVGGQLGSALLQGGAQALTSYLLK